VLARLGEVPQFREQGLLGRVLYSVPDSLMGWRKNNPEPMPGALASAYHEHITALTLTLAGLGEPTELAFTPSGAAAVTGMLADTEPRFRPGTGDLAHMTDWGGKLVGATVRIAGLLHLATHLRDGWASPINAATFDNARQLGDYYTTHAQAAYDTIGADPAVADARAILTWARNTTVSRFTTRDILPPLRHRFTKTTDIEPALRILESHGWIRRLPAPPHTGRGRPTAPAWEFHPEVSQ
jgi:hypothetical protein